MHSLEILPLLRVLSCVRLLVSKKAAFGAFALVYPFVKEIITTEKLEVTKIVGRKLCVSLVLIRAELRFPKNHLTNHGPTTHSILATLPDRANQS